MTARQRLPGSGLVAVLLSRQSSADSRAIGLRCSLCHLIRFGQFGTDHRVLCPAATAPAAEVCLAATPAEATGTISTGAAISGAEPPRPPVPPWAVSRSARTHSAAKRLQVWRPAGKRWRASVEASHDANASVSSPRLKSLVPGNCDLDQFRVETRTSRSISTSCPSSGVRVCTLSQTSSVLLVMTFFRQRSSNRRTGSSWSPTFTMPEFSAREKGRKQTDTSRRTVSTLITWTHAVGEGLFGTRSAPTALSRPVP